MKYWQKRHELIPGARYEVGDLPEIFGKKSFSPADQISDDVLDDAHRLLDGTYGQPREAPSRALFSDLTPDEGTPEPPERVRDFMSWPYGALLALAEYSRIDPDNRRDHVEPMFRFDTQMLMLLGWGTHLAAKWLADRVRRKPSLVWYDAILFVLPLLVMPVAALIVDAAPTGRFVLGLLFTGSLLNVVLRARSGIAAHHTNMRQDLARAREPPRQRRLPPGREPRGGDPGRPPRRFHHRQDRAPGRSHRRPLPPHAAHLRPPPRLAVRQRDRERRDPRLQPADQRQPVRAELRHVHFPTPAQLPIDKRTVTVVIEDPLGGRGIVPPTPVWAMISVTNNVTQQITTITPN